MRSSRSGVGPVLVMRGAVAWGRLAAHAGSAPAPAPCHQEHLWGQGLRDSSTPVPQSWCGALAPPIHPTNPLEQSSKSGPTKAQSKMKPGYSTSQTPKGKGRRAQQLSLQCHFSPSMWIDFSSPSSSTSTRSRPFSIILQTDKQMDSQGPCRKCTTAGSCRVRGLLVERSLWEQGGLARPHLLVVIRLPLTKVVEVETERKPSPASAPELKDEAKKSRQGSNKVGARVGGKRRAGDRLPRGTWCSRTPLLGGVAVSPT